MGTYYLYLFCASSIIDFNSFLNSDGFLTSTKSSLQLFFRDKWIKYYAEHHENEWTGYEITCNGIFTSEEKMREIYEIFDK